MIFLHITKTAGQSILRATKLKGMCHLPLRCLDVGDEDIFTIIRNPYDRAVSTYYYIQQLQQQRPNWIAKNHKRPRNPIIDFKEPSEWWCYVYDNRDDFMNTENGECREVRYRLGAYYRKQIDYMNEADGEPISERIGTVLRFETLAQDWPAFAAAHGFGNLPHANASQLRQGRKWQDELTPESIAKIGELYADDFEHLGYERL